MGYPSGFASRLAAVAARIPIAAASAPAFLKNSRLEMSAINGSFYWLICSFLKFPSADVLVFDGAGKASRFSRGRPLERNRRRVLPVRFGWIGRVVRDVADLLVVQPHLKMRALEADADVIPVALL